MEEKLEKKESQKTPEQNIQNPNKEETPKVDLPKEKPVKTEMCQLIYYDFSIK